MNLLSPAEARRELDTRRVLDSVKSRDLVTAVTEVVLPDVVARNHGCLDTWLFRTDVEAVSR